MNVPNRTAPVEQARSLPTLGLNRWLEGFLTIIAGVVVAVIAWNIIEHFMHIIILMLASFLVAFLLTPLVERLEKMRVPRIAAILLVYLIIIGALVVGGILLIGPLTNQLQTLTETLPGLIDTNTGLPADLNNFFTQNNIPINLTELLNRLGAYVTEFGSSLLGGTLAVVAGLVGFVTDIFLVLAITFYLLLDGRGMRNRMLRFLSEKYRERWFFIQATLNRVLGGYIRGQIVVALTVGLAAGLGTWVIGVPYPLVIGLLAFLFEFVPMLGPVLGMVPAVIIALFVSPTLALWTVIFFIVLQQIESNVIVPRVSGHAVGLHPLAALLALLAGFELGGLGGALIGVPIVGVIYVLALAIYTDVTGNTELLVTKPQPTTYDSLRDVISGRRGRRVTTTPRQAAMPPTAVVAPTAVAPEQIPNERLTSIAGDQAQLIAQFQADEREQAATEQSATPVETIEGPKLVKPAGPDDVKAPPVP